MTKTKPRKIVIVSVILTVIIGLWVGGIIPQQIGKMTAINYVKNNHGSMELVFVRMDYSRAHGDYFAVFKDPNGEVYNFLIHAKLLPITVLFDPIDLPG